MKTKRYLGLLVATIGVFMCIYYTFTMRRIEQEHKINSMLLDYDLVSIEDYSIRGKVKKGFYEQAMKETEPTEEEKTSCDSEIKRRIVPIRRLKRYLV